MTNRELLELAAKAAGYVFVVHTGYDEDECVYVTHTWIREPGHLVEWNPLLDDGDALRLAVKIGIDVLTPDGDNKAGSFYSGGDEIWEDASNDPYAATRRAIVRAAAEIGKESK